MTGGIGTSPAVPLDPPAPLQRHAVHLPPGGVSGEASVPARAGDEEEEGHIQSSGWALPRGRGHRTPPGALPPWMCPACELSRDGHGVPSWPHPPSPRLGARRQERGAEQAAVPALGLLLPAPTCSDSHRVVHPHLPALVLRCCQTLPGRGRESHRQERTKLLLTQLCLLLFLSPAGPRPGYGSCPHLSGCPEPPRPGWSGGCPGREREAATAPALAVACSH